jgi:hypothetical protein
MIPQRLVDFMHGSVLAFVGTRDARLRPAVTWAFGLRAAAATGEITAFVPDVEIEQTRNNLSHNGLVALTVVHPISHECYQFKGKLAGMRATTDEERAVQDILRSKLVTLLAVFPPGQALISRLVVAPSTAISLKVEQAFLQTPGPGAGRQLDLAAES